MSSRPLARRYAVAIFQLATQANEVERWRRELALLDELFREDVLVAAFRNPAVTLARRLELARRLAPELWPPAWNLLRLLVERQRTRQIGAIRQEFESLADEAAGIVHVALTTAVELEGDERQRYETALTRRLGRQVRLRVRADPSLIGGATIRIGDHLVDGSVRTQLERLRQGLVA